MTLSKLSDSKSARWTALIIVSFTMMFGYFFTDVMSPLEPLLTAAPSTEFTASVSGKVTTINVQKDQVVKQGDIVLTLTDGKAERHITAIADGKVKSIDTKAGQSVNQNDILVKIEYPDTKFKAAAAGQVAKVHVASDQAVKKGDVLMSIKAGTEQQTITADADGTIKSIKASAGQNVKKDDVVMVLKHTVNVSPEIGRAGKGLDWSSDDYGFFSGSYGFFNVFLLLLFFGGIILDKFGIRFTGIMSTVLMFCGALIKWYAVGHSFEGEMFGYPMQVIWACLGFAIYGVGCEIAGITVSKVIVKWFTGHELALAMGLQVALARIGTAAALGASLPFANMMGSEVSASVGLGAALLCAGMISFIVYSLMDKKLDRSTAATQAESEEGFKFTDLKILFCNKGFWLITLLCLMFYAGVFPFLKFATKLMVTKYGVDAALAGLIPAMLPFGTIFLTPLFGNIYDKHGKGATLMIIGSVLLTLVHAMFAFPLNSVAIALMMMIILGIAFGLVPSAMWPSVPKIIPMKLLGTAYAVIFYIQNIGLSMVPILIGKVNDANTTTVGQTDYTLSMTIFAAFGLIAILLSLALKVEDRKKHYGLEEANIK